jgi:hypothetical protein
MGSITPCYRHARRTWIAACADCTAWHLATAVARRDGRGGPDPSRPPSVPSPVLPGHHPRTETT